MWPSREDTEISQCRIHSCIQSLSHPYLPQLGFYAIFYINVYCYGINNKPLQAIKIKIYYTNSVLQLTLMFLADFCVLHVVANTESLSEAIIINLSLSLLYHIYIFFIIVLLHFNILLNWFQIHYIYIYIYIYIHMVHASNVVNPCPIE